MNNHSGKSKFENFRIILDRGSSSTIVVDKLTSKLKTKEAAETMWETQASKFMTSNKVNIYLCLPEFQCKKECDV